MNRFVLVTVLVCCWVSPARAQYEFLFFNVQAPTHLGSIDGPLAGPDIWAQMAAGLDPDSLGPVGAPAHHWPNGLVEDGPRTVPGADVFGIVYVQMFAWDGQMWGSEFDQVPAEWLGSTDVVSVRLGGQYGAVFRSVEAPLFTQPAIVPVPEPSTAALVAYGALLMLAFQTSRRRRKHPTNSTAVRLCHQWVPLPLTCPPQRR